MINKQHEEEIYYVISRSELRRLIDTAERRQQVNPRGFDIPGDTSWEDFENAEVACYTREVEPMPPEPKSYLWKEKR